MGGRGSSSKHTPTIQELKDAWQPIIKKELDKQRAAGAHWRDTAGLRLIHEEPERFFGKLPSKKLTDSLKD
jgi:hypothetical protein